jgi:hypothetical protein
VSPRFVLLITLPNLSCSDYSFGVDESSSNAEPWIPPVEEQITGGLSPADACDEVKPTITSVAIDESCNVEPSDGELDAVIEWEFLKFANYREYSQSVMSPMVGQLTDDNGDGVINNLDMPDIVLVTDDDGAVANEHGILRIISGDGQGPNYSSGRSDITVDGSNLQLYPYRYTNAALGDVDGDGAPEIILVVHAVGGTSNGGGGDKGGGGEDTSPPQKGEDSGGYKGGEDTEDPDDSIRPPPPDGDSADHLTGESCQVAAFDTNLEAKWSTTQVNLACGGHAPVLADLDGDGNVEVILGPYVFKGSDGSLIKKGQGDTGRYYAYSEIGLNSIVVDLEGDGQQEIIAGRTVYNSDVSVRCTGDSSYDGYAAAADLDMDGEGEFLVVGNGTVAMFEGSDCALMSSWSLQGGGTGGPPTISDYDGDGRPEIGLADASTYTVYETDGSILWSTQVTDASSHATGSVVFDFEGDGFPEVIYADEVTLWVFDGRDGRVRLSESQHESRTLHEFPTVADVDGDGSAEIITVNGGSHYQAEAQGMFVIGSSSSSWEAGRQVWNQHAYNIVNVNDDLSIPATPEPNWPNYNNFRSGNVNPGSGGSSPDAVPVVTVCTDECEYGRLVIHARIGNSGPVPLRSGLPITVYTEDDGVYTPLETAWTSDIADSGGTSDEVEFNIDLDDIPDGTLWVMVDSIGEVGYARECNELNNAVELTDLACP